MTITRDEFIDRYIAGTDWTPESLYRFGRNALPCDPNVCDDIECPGWQMLPVARWGRRLTHELVDNVHWTIMAAVIESVVVDIIGHFQWVDRHTIEWSIVRPEQEIRGDNADYIIVATLWWSRTLPRDRMLSFAWQNER